ncbi:hypothetical protein OHT61_32400 (plasmid) [Streptomyces sp. NBC_00178]|uniref:DUF7224 domain-containing protein n=1 Tax=Streptomyces sp. NBC_00178 TaxID=2975672 RepID=UPI002E2DC251|nr:hypothetical protein [Streptomyces sp. NBC_00178]
MISLGNLRASSTPWLLLPALLYMASFVGGDNFWGVPDYGPSSGELASWGITVIAPAVAGAAAWEAGRQRSMGDIRKVSSRSTVRQWFWAARPVFVLHLLLVAGALVMARITVGVWPSGAGLLAVGHLVILPCGWMVIGWVLGLLCPRAVAALVAAVGGWAWLAMPRSLSAPAWRHLTGFATEGSTLTDTLDPLVYLVPWLVTAGLTVAVVLLTGVRRRPWLIAVSVAVLVATLAAGRTFVSDWGYSPLTEARVGHTVCVGTSPALCLPEEYEKRAAGLRNDSLPALEALRAAGVPSPQTLQMSSDDVGPKPGTWPLYWSPENSTEQFQIDLARSAVTGVAALHGVRDCRQPYLAETWALLVVGVEEKDVRASVPPQDWTQVQRIRELPSTQQADWFTKAAVDQTHCVVGQT